MSGRSWLETDRKGLRALWAGKSKAFILRELVANGWDEPGVTSVDVLLRAVPGQAKTELQVIDDAPEGFHDIRHAFTLFADNRKRPDPKLRGRFNLGEKLVLAVCDEARIRTTSAHIVFSPTEGRIHRRTGYTARGSVFSATLPMTRAELDEALRVARTFIPPAGICTTVNGKHLPYRQPEADFESKLTTEYADAEGIMRTGQRKTHVRIYEPLEGETPSLYEMGLPVCETGDRWHYDVSQRVPLTADREHVRPAYLRDLRAETLNRMHEDLEVEEAAEPWVQDAMTDERAQPEAVRSVVTAQHGERAFVPTPSDPKANERAIAMGYRPVSGRSYGRDAWENIREAEALPSAVAVAGETLTADFEPIPAKEWTDDMRRVSRLAQAVADVGLNIPVCVRMIRSKAGTGADYAGRTIRFNVQRLGKSWFRPECLEDQIGLIVHEIAHEYGGHLEMGYQQAKDRIAARLALAPPALFKEV